MSDPVYFEISLTKKLHGTHAGPLHLSWWTMTDSEDEEETEECGQITTVDLKGLPVADGLELDLDPSSYKGGKTWTLDMNSIILDDEEGNETTIELNKVEIRMPRKGKPSAKAWLGEQGEDVLVSENWVD